jgi:hypothetical protein
LGQFFFEYLYSPRKRLTSHFVEEADNLFLVSLALGAMYIIASVIEVYGVISVSMVKKYNGMLFGKCTALILSFFSSNG